MMMLHVRDCTGLLHNGDACPFPWCGAVKHLLYHLVSCTDGDRCTVCNPPGDGAAEELERRAYGAAVAPRAVRSALEEASLATSAERLRGAEASDWFAPKPDPPFWRLVKGNLGLLRPEGPSDQ